MRSVEEMVKYYKDMQSRPSSSYMVDEVEWQYKDMAKGGTGGDLGFEKNGETTCRGINYKGYPDSFFQRVCEEMGWLPSKETIALETYSSDPM